jgi:hypothetical protein
MKVGNKILHEDSSQLVSYLLLIVLTFSHRAQSLKEIVIVRFYNHRPMQNISLNRGRKRIHPNKTTMRLKAMTTSQQFHFFIG